MELKRWGVFWIDLFVEPYFSDTNKIIGYTIIAYDTTNKKKKLKIYIRILIVKLNNIMQF